MHDIICPQCGESFIARDVVFDFSDYILSLISSESNEEAARELGFKFYVDEENIRNNPAPNNEVDLNGDSKNGYGSNNKNYFHCEITNKLVFEYVIEKAGLNPDNFKEVMSKIANESTIRGEDFDTSTVGMFRKIINFCFPKIADELKALGGFNITADRVTSVINIMRHIYNTQDDKETIGVRMFCSRMNPQRIDYSVPDRLFVLNLNGQMDLKLKCCKWCGTIFPEEFGYYKMVPITMLGSHFSAKTSFLVALNWCIENRPPFNDPNRFRIKKLKGDPELEVIVEQNVKNFENGIDTIKTEPFSSQVPIISYLINDTIYTFTDWPGEEFINNKTDTLSFAYMAKRIIAKSRHFICCLVPEQIIPGIRPLIEGREKVDYTASELIRRFNEHIELTNKLRSVTFIINKFDVFEDAKESDPGAAAIINLIKGISESDVLAEPAIWNDLSQKTQEFIKDKMTPLHTGAVNAYQKDYNLCFIPVAPYGRDGKPVSPSGENAAAATADRSQQGYLVGLPLLHILKCDGINISG